MENDTVKINYIQYIEDNLLTYRKYINTYYYTYNNI